MIDKGNGVIEGNPRRILLIQLGDIGDVVLSFPVAAALRARFPSVRLVMAVRAKVGDLVACCPDVDNVVWVHSGQGGGLRSMVAGIRFFRGLRQERFDLAVDFRTGTRGSVPARLSGASQRVGFFARDEPRWRNWLFTDLASPRHPPQIHMALFYGSLIEEYGVPVSHPWPRLVPPEAVQAQVDVQLRQLGVDPDRPLVVVQPYSLWAYKEWGDERVAALCRHIEARFKAQIAISGAPDEAVRAETLVRAGDVPLINLAGKTSLAQMAAVLVRAHLFIGMDSAGMHIAAGVGTPTVTLFGPTSAADWAPRGPRHVSVTSGADCVPCYQKGCDGSLESRCMAELTVDRVFEAVCALWGKNERDDFQN